MANRKLITIAVCLLAASALCAQDVVVPPSGGNQKASTSQWIGLVEVNITYSSPRVNPGGIHDRTGQIWGTLVPYGFNNPNGLASTSTSAPWRAGANENTVISFSHDVEINDKPLKAGSYGLFLAVQKDGPWTWIFSSNHTSWGAFSYDANEDVLRVDAQPEDNAFTDYLTYGFNERNQKSAVAFLAWEKKKVSMTIEVPNINDYYIADIRNTLRSPAALDYHNWLTAARFCADNKTNLEEGLKWADNALNARYGGLENFGTLSTKADILKALGKTAESKELMNKAVRHSSASMEQVHSYGRSLLTAGEKESALEVFQYNSKAHPEDKFMTMVGLARGYTAVGNKKEAIKYWEVALKNVPENQKNNTPVWQAELDKLKSN